MLEYNCICLSSCPFSGTDWLLYSEPVPQRKNAFPPLSLLLLSSLILFFCMVVAVPRAAKRIFSFTQMRNSCCLEYEMGTRGEGSDVTGGDSANPVCSRGCLNVDLGHSKCLSQGLGSKEVISHPYSSSYHKPQHRAVPPEDSSSAGEAVYSWAAHSHYF